MVGFGVVVVGTVIGIFTMGLEVFLDGGTAVVVVISGFFVAGLLLGDRGFLVGALGGEILIWMRLSSAKVVTGRRVFVGGRGFLVVVVVVVALDLI